MPAPKAPDANRRTFLKISGGAGAGLILGLAAPVEFATTQAMAADAPFAPNPFVKVAPDNSVTVIIKHLDKGQGAATGLATLVAEELDASHDQIRTEFAPSDPIKYVNFAFGIQGVGGSTGLANSYEQYRKAGATARAMLVAAAARGWGVDAATITVKAGVVSSASGKIGNVRRARREGRRRIRAEGRCCSRTRRTSSSSASRSPASTARSRSRARPSTRSIISSMAC